MSQFKPVDWVVVILTVTLSGILIATCVTQFLDVKGMSDTKGQRVVGIVGGVVSIISMYVGANIRKHIEKE